MEEKSPKAAESGRGMSSRALRMYTCYPGELIIEQGAHSAHFYVILSGQVQTTYRSRKTLLLKEQDIFGLQHVLFKSPSSYTAVAVVESRIAAYGEEALNYFIAENPRMTDSILRSVTRQFTNLMEDPLPDRQETFALEDCDIQFLRDGECVIEEGALGGDFYRLVSTEGGLRVSIGGLEVNRIERPGEFFGEMAGLLNLPRQATITSIGQSVVEVYANDKLDVLIRDYPVTALRLMQMLVSRLAAMNRRSQGDNS